MKRRWFIAVILMMCVCLAACGVEMQELSEEETELITEYAAGLIIKNDARVAGKLLDDETLAAKAEAEAEARAKQRAYEEAAAAYLANKENARKKETESTSSSGEGSESSGTMVQADMQIGSIASFYGIDGCDVGYTGYELCDSYPNSGEELLMAMEASPGKQLLILKFDVNNVSGGDVNFDMFYRGASFSLSVDGGNRIHNQATLLLDDMAAYAGNISPGEDVPMVLVYEVDDTVSSINNMTLTVSGDAGKGTIQLQ